VPDRLFEHPATVFVLTNMYYAEAPWLTPVSPAAASGMIWREVALRGASSGEFEAQIADWGRFWRKTGAPTSARARACRSMSGRWALVLYREDHRFLLDQIIPRAGRTEANFDLIVASQPYRAKSSVNFRAKTHHCAAGPGAAGRRPPDRIHSHGGDPGLEIISGLARRKPFRREPS